MLSPGGLSGRRSPPGSDKLQPSLVRSPSSSSSLASRQRQPMQPSSGPLWTAADGASRWGWCVRPQELPPASVRPDPVVRASSAPKLLGGACMVPGENYMMFGRTRHERPGIQPGQEPTPFFGLKRPLGLQAGWNSRCRGGKFAAEGWAGTFPDRVHGTDRGRIICDGRGM